MEELQTLVKKKEIHPPFGRESVVLQMILWCPDEVAFSHFGSRLFLI